MVVGRCSRSITANNMYEKLYQRLTNMQSITYTIEIKWRIKNFDNYGFGSDKNLYNTKTNRKLKKCYNGGSIGYWFGDSFITLYRLKPLIYKPIEINIPF